MPALQSSVAVYPIGVVQRLTGLSARQIRYYEKEGLLRPSRTRGNRRLYSLADVERLRQVKVLLEQGLNLEGVRAYLAAQEGQAPGEGLPLPGPASVRAAGRAGRRGAAPRQAEEPAPPPPPPPGLGPGDGAPGQAAAAGPGPDTQAPPSPMVPQEPQPAVYEAAPRPEEHHPGIFRQARGRRLSSLFPVDQQAELMRWLQAERRGD